MNWFVLIAGLFAAFVVIGHFAIGSKQYLKPMLEASFDDVSKKVMHCVFHYVSAYLILSALALLMIGSGLGLQGDTPLLTRFIALNYAVFAVWQIILAASSSIPNGVFKLFQWIFFALIAIFAWIGS